MQTPSQLEPLHEAAAGVCLFLPFLFKLLWKFLLLNTVLLVRVLVCWVLGRLLVLARRFLGACCAGSAFAWGVRGLSLSRSRGRQSVEF